SAACVGSARDLSVGFFGLPTPRRTVANLARDLELNGDRRIIAVLRRAAMAREIVQHHGRGKTARYQRSLCRGTSFALYLAGTCGGGRSDPDHLAAGGDDRFLARPDSVPAHAQ